MVILNNLALSLRDTRNHISTEERHFIITIAVTLRIDYRGTTAKIRKSSWEITVIIRVKEGSALTRKT